MNTWQLFKLLRRHRQLAEKRSLSNAGNKAAKVVITLMSSFVIVYLLGAAVMLALIANDGGRYTSPEILCMCLPFIFALDFFLRFTVQQTPSQMVKPYLLRQQKYLFLPTLLQECLTLYCPYLFPFRFLG